MARLNKEKAFCTVCVVVQTRVGEALDALKELNLADYTIVVFASDNGPTVEEYRALGNLGSQDMGNGGPFRGDLGMATEGAIRTAAIVRWPGHDLVCHVLDNGLHANVRQYYWHQDAHRPADRRSGPNRCANGQERHRA